MPPKPLALRWLLPLALGCLHGCMPPCGEADMPGQWRAAQENLALTLHPDGRYEYQFENIAQDAVTVSGQWEMLPEHQAVALHGFPAHERERHMAPWPTPAMRQAMTGKTAIHLMPVSRSLLARRCHIVPHPDLGIRLQKLP